MNGRPAIRSDSPLADKLRKKRPVINWNDRMTLWHLLRWLDLPEASFVRGVLADFDKRANWDLRLETIVAQKLLEIPSKKL